MQRSLISFYPLERQLTFRSRNRSILSSLPLDFLENNNNKTFSKSNLFQVAKTTAILHRRTRGEMEGTRRRYRYCFQPRFQWLYIDPSFRSLAWINKHGDGWNERFEIGDTLLRLETTAFTQRRRRGRGEDIGPFKPHPRQIWLSRFAPSTLSCFWTRFATLERASRVFSSPSPLRHRLPTPPPASFFHQSLFLRFRPSSNPPRREIAKFGPFGRRLERNAKYNERALRSFIRKINGAIRFLENNIIITRPCSSPPPNRSTIRLIVVESAHWIFVRKIERKGSGFNIRFFFFSRNFHPLSPSWNIEVCYNILSYYF